MGGALLRILTLLMVCAASTATVLAQPTIPVEAEMVYGQPDYDTIAAGSGAGRLDFVVDAALHEASDTLFALDYLNNRVLRWSGATGQVAGADADAVFGGACLGVPTPGCLEQPQQMAVDAAGGLWVADNGSQRLVYFADAVTAPSGTPAARVLGAPTLTQTGTIAVNSVFLADNRLYAVAEDQLLSWSYQTLPESGAPPRVQSLGAIDQPVFGIGDPAYGGFWLVRQFMVDVSFFPYRGAAYYYAPGADPRRPTGMLGWRSGDEFPVQSQKTLLLPYRAVMARDGTLYIVDSTAHRVVGYRDALNRATARLAGGPEQPADLLYGQLDWSDATPAAGLTGLNMPYAVALDHQRNQLYIADGGNNRVVRYPVDISGAAPPLNVARAADCNTLPDLAVSPAQITLEAGGTARLELALRNVGTTVHGYSDLVLSLSDGLQVVEAAGMRNLTARAAVQINELQPNQTLRYTVTVGADAALPTAPLFVVEQYCGGRVVQRIDGVFSSGPTAEVAPQPAALTAVPAVVIAPLPAALPNTAGEQAPAPLPVVPLLLVIAAAAGLRRLVYRRGWWTR